MHVCSLLFCALPTLTLQSTHLVLVHSSYMNYKSSNYSNPGYSQSTAYWILAPALIIGD